MGEEALAWERATKTKQANKLVQSEARTLGSGGVGSLCDASLPTWESSLWVQSGTSPIASSVHAGGKNVPIPLQKYPSCEILPSEQPSGEFLGQKLTGLLIEI